MINSDLTREESIELYNQVLYDNDIQAQRRLCREDLFYLLLAACKRTDINRNWLYDRCREVELEPDGYLDLWAREHYKSTILNFGLNIQDILNDPDTTIGIFSHTRPIAKAFLEQIKRELEDNDYLKNLFPDILYENPKSQAPKWSLETGIIVKRKSNPKEATIEAWGLVDGQPTSKHYKVLLYDDVVTRESVTTPDQIKKVTEAWELSLNLGSDGGRERYVGTRYHFNDSYKTMLDRKSAIPRIYPATDDGTMAGNPVLLSREALEKKKRDLGVYTFSCQQLLNPVADSAKGFKLKWMRYYHKTPDTRGWNIYLLCDPAASKKKKGNDYTVMRVIALGTDRNYYLIDGCRDRMNLSERTQKLFYYHRKYNPKATGYEQYGMQSDIEHIRDKMDDENYRFHIIEIYSKLAKEERIEKLIPLYEYGRFWHPQRLLYTDNEKKYRDLTKEFVDDEYLAYPVAVHDDMLDCDSMILNPLLGAKFPKEKQNQEYNKKFSENSKQNNTATPFKNFSYNPKVRRVT